MDKNALIGVSQFTERQNCDTPILYFKRKQRRRLMMKEMEAKTENRYEYRKPQEKRKQMIAPNLFEFAYVPD